MNQASKTEDKLRMERAREEAKAKAEVKRLENEKLLQREAIKNAKKRERKKNFHEDSSEVSSSDGTDSE